MADPEPTRPSRTPPTGEPTAPYAGIVAATPPPTIATRGKPAIFRALAAGDRVAQYQILKPLGEGGMGVVYKGWDVHLRRSVALKVLRPDVATDPTARQRFVREARAAAAVEHDHVVAIHQVGEDQGIAFIAMQYLHGVPLDRFLASRGRGAALDPAQVMRIGREAAAGLAAAHAKGLVHRDIKPSNVWLEAPKGRVKLLDFGIAKQARPTADDKRGLTEPGVVMGTPAYMSPEQARGWATDGRSDLFSLGAVLYELLTGSAPFTRPTVMETLTALAKDDPPPITDRNPGVPAGLVEVVGRLMAKDPAARYQSGTEVATALRKLERDLVTKRSVPVLPAAPDPAAQKTTDVVDADPGYEVIETGAVPIAAETDEIEPPRPKRKRRRAGKRASRGLTILALVGGVALGGLIVAGVAVGLTRGKKEADPPPAAKPAPEPDDRQKQWEAVRPTWMPAESPPPPWWQPGVRLPDEPPPGWQPGKPIPPPGVGNGPPPHPMPRR